MPITVFDPKEVEVGPIGPMMASKVSAPGLKAFFEAKSKEDSDGNLSSIVIGDSNNMGMGVGTWEPGQHTKKPIPIMFDEAIFVVEGSFQLQVDGQHYNAEQGECIHITPGSLVNFSSKEGCRIVWVTCPPTWVALEKAFNEGKIK